MMMMVMISRRGEMIRNETRALVGGEIKRGRETDRYHTKSTKGLSGKVGKSFKVVLS